MGYISANEDFQTVGAFGCGGNCGCAPCAARKFGRHGLAEWYEEDDEPEPQTALPNSGNSAIGESPDPFPSQANQMLHQRANQLLQQNGQGELLVPPIMLPWQKPGMPKQLPPPGFLQPQQPPLLMRPNQKRLIPPAQLNRWRILHLPPEEEIRLKKEREEERRIQEYFKYIHNPRPLRRKTD